MNITEYINSGIIEDYCLGVLNPIEMRVVARNSELYQEIKDAIDKTEEVLKRYTENIDTNLEIDFNSEEIFFRLLSKMKNTF